MARYAAFAELSYCALNTDPLTLSEPPRALEGWADPACSHDELPSSPPVAASVVWTLPTDPLFSSRAANHAAFAALPADDDGEIVLAFRGSRNWRDWTTNAQIWRNDIDWCNECGVHHGDWSAWIDMRDAVAGTVRELMKKRKRLVVVGQSLGGAIATLAAAELRRMNLGIDIEMVCRSCSPVSITLFIYCLSGPPLSPWTRACRRRILLTHAYQNFSSPMAPRASRIKSWPSTSPIKRRAVPSASQRRATR